MGDVKKKKRSKRLLPELDDRGFLSEMKELKLSYRKEYWKVRRALKKTGEKGDHPDEKLLRDTLKSLTYAIMWMHTGREPGGSKRGIERRAAYQRNKMVDPLIMQSMKSGANAGGPSNLSDWERFQLEEALRRLSPRERECYEMKHGQGFSHSYIAKLLKIDKDSVKEYVDRAQRKVTADLDNNLFLI